MGDINQAIREIVREELSSLRVEVSAEPDMISVAAAAKLLGCSRNVVDALHRDRLANGFPSVQLGPRTISVDKRRLNQWLASGGLMVSV
jgi:predicted DNA-binding transcriptional regulator AlpA